MQAGERIIISDGIVEICPYFIRAIIDPHNTLEEKPEEVYAQCEKVIGVKIEDLLRRLLAVTGYQ